MPFLTSTESVVLTTRTPLELAARVEDFAREAGLSRSAALRVLLERGLDGGIDVDQLRMVSYNARAEALDELEHALGALVEQFFRYGKGSGRP